MERCAVHVEIADRDMVLVIHMNALISADWIVVKVQGLACAGIDCLFQLTTAADVDRPRTKFFNCRCDRIAKITS